MFASLMERSIAPGNTIINIPEQMQARGIVFNNRERSVKALDVGGLRAYFRTLQNKPMGLVCNARYNRASASILKLHVRT